MRDVIWTMAVLVEYLTESAYQGIEVSWEDFGTYLAHR